MTRTDDDLKDFSAYLLIEKGLSQNTADNYLRDVRAFFEFIKKEDTAITKSDIMAYLIKLNEHYSTSSIQRKLVSLRQFFLYLEKSKIISHNMMSEIDMPKKSQALPKVVSIEEADQLLCAIDTSTPIGKRDYCMILLTLATGMRVSEMVNLKTSDFSYQARRVKVIGKGNKERFIPVDEKTCDIIEDYIQNDRRLLNKKDMTFIFFNAKGNPMTRENFYNILQKRVKQAGINGHFTPHKLRHTFATTMLEENADLRSIQELLGHSNISTTTIYTHVANDKIIDDYRHYFPRERRKGEDE